MAIKCVSSLGDFVNSFGGDEYTNIQDALLAARQYKDAGVFGGSKSTPEGDKIYSVYDELPEVQVYAKDLSKPYESAFDYSGAEAVREGLGVLPIAGDILDSIDALTAVNNENYLEASLLGASLLLPNALEKPIKWVGKKAMKAYKNFRRGNHADEELEAIIKNFTPLKFNDEYRLQDLDKQLQKRANREYVQEVNGDRWKEAFELAQERGFLTNYDMDEVREALTAESSLRFNGIPFLHQSDDEMRAVHTNWGQGETTPIAYATNKDGKETIFMNSDKNYKNGITDDELDTGVHEVAHGNTLRYEPGIGEQEIEGIRAFMLKKEDPTEYRRQKIIKDVMKYNEYISNRVNAGEVVNPRTGNLYVNEPGKEDMDDYLRQIQEMRSRAYSINTNATRNNISAESIIDNADINTSDARMQAAQLKAATHTPKTFTKEVLSTLPILGLGASSYFYNQSNQKALGGNLYGPEEEVKGMENYLKSATPEIQERAFNRNNYPLINDKLNIIPDEFAYQQMAKHIVNGDGYFEAGELPEITILPNNNEYEKLEALANAMFFNLDRKSRNTILRGLDGMVDNKTSSNEGLKRLYDMWEWGGNPSISSKGSLANKLGFIAKGRPNYNPIYNKMSNTKALPVYLSELSHAYQRNNKDVKNAGLGYFSDIDILPADIKIDGKSGYRRNTNPEYKAHQIIEPKLIEYLKNGTPIEFAQGGPLSSYSPSGALKPVTTLEKFVNKYADGGNMFDGEITVPFLPTYTPSFTINSGNSLIAQATNRAIQQGVKRRNEAEADAKADKKNQAIHKGKDGSKYMTGNAGQALMFFMDKGLSEEQALGMVANLMGESELNPTAYTSAGGGQGAYGIAQWRGDRLRALRKKYGEKPTLNQQLEFVWHELNTTHKEGLKQLKASKTAHEAASAALGYYEFQGGVQSAINSFNEHGQDGRAAYMSKLNWVNRLQGKALLPKDYDNKHLLHNDIIQVGNDIDNTAHAVPAQYLYPFPEARIPSYEVNQPIVPTSSLESFVDSYNTKKYEETTPENLLEKLQLQQELEEQKTLKRNLFNYAIESTQTPTFQMQLPQQVSGQQLMNLWDNYFRF